MFASPYGDDCRDALRLSQDDMLTVLVSPHLLADVAACETKARVRHIDGYTSRSESLKAVAGQAWHRAMESYFDVANDSQETSARWALSAFHTLYDPKWQAASADDLPDKAYTPDNLHKLLARWLEMHPHGSFPWRRVIAVEEAFASLEWEVAPGVIARLVTRPDLVVEDTDGLIRWVDSKTTGWRISDTSWRRALRLSLQAQLYTAALRHTYGESRTALGGWFSAVEIRTVPSDPTRKCKEHGNVAYAECGAEHTKAELIECMTTPELIAQAVDDANEYAYRFVTQPLVGMQGLANGTCRFCFAADWCLASRPRAAMDSMFVYEPWPIEVGRRRADA